MNDLSITDMKFIHQRLADEEDSNNRRFAQKEQQTSTTPTGKKQKKGKQGGSKKGGSKKKSKKEAAEEQAGYLLKQRKTLLQNYLTATAKLKVTPIAAIVHQMEIHESVEWSKEDRDAAMGALLSIVSEGARVGPGNMRAVCCAITGKWLSTTTSSPSFAPKYDMLLHLGISKGDIGSTGAIAVAALLETKTCTLRTLRLLSNNIGTSGCYALGNALSFAGGNKSLIELYIDGDESVGDEGCAELCGRLELNSSLKVLSLSSCGITATGAGTVGDMLRSIRNGIQYLSLECNSLTGGGIEALCNNGFSTLQVLNLASAGVIASDSLAACEALGQCIRISKALQAVDFNLNALTIDSAKHLSECLVKARRDGSRIDEFIVTTSIDHSSFQALALDPSIMSGWNARMKEVSKKFRRTPTPSPFMG